MVLTSKVGALPEKANLINGEWRKSDQRNETKSPITGEVIGYYYEPSETDVEEAIQAAQNAFVQTEWRHNRHMRAKALNDLADQLEKRHEEIIKLLSKENGKVIGEAGFEFSLTPPKLRYYAALALTDTGQSAQIQQNFHSTLISEPIGVAGVIVPWNSPVILSVRSFAPALAAGCTCVIKMPAQTALVNGLLAEIIADTPSLPAGVLNIITESGDIVSKKLIEAKEVGVISYTGSTQVGRKIMEGCSKRLKRMSLELGGKTPMIVFNDADLDAVIPTLVAGITTFTGQFCMTGSRILVQSGIAEDVRKRLTEALLTVKVGPGNDPNSQMGPLIDAANAVRVDQKVEEMIAGGAEVIVRGGRGKTEMSVVSESDAYYRPTLLATQNLNSPLIQEEIFGPVASFEIFETDEEAIERANATDYGLSASIWTSNRDRSLRMPNKIDAGTVWINAWAIVFDQFEEGGFKQSGIGRLNGLTALAEFQEYKHVVQATN
ncbi:aldehyde dehydrogenase family protein [Bacillus sp. Sa1BUA2]|uniref:Aldehyde dehydrogenase family protein n=1 Tax=Bacillus norwichensis TaxID=2762217 RepID=A0ABR8VSA0_9BACI|nr:aldehyde dehydrogenase family protein [Bacillus norwichensis]